jgi:hypothetical protein
LGLCKVFIEIQWIKILYIYIYIMYKDRKNIGKSIKRKSIKRKSIKRKNIKRKSIKRKSITFSGGAEPYGKGIEPPIVMQLPIDDEIIKFSEEIKKQLIDKIGPEKYNSIGWFRKKILTDIPKGCFSKPNPAKFIIDERLPYIIGLISQKLIDNGLPVKEKLQSSDINVEIHYANAESKAIGSGLVIHQDNDGGINGFLHTFIVYLDIECEGGELEIYDDKGKKLVETIDVKTSPSGTKNIVMFNGGLYHKPRQITNGKRVIVSYQIRQDNSLESGGGGHPTTSITARHFTPPPGGEYLDSCPNGNYEEDSETNNWSA